MYRFIAGITAVLLIGISPVQAKHRYHAQKHHYQVAKTPLAAPPRVLVDTAAIAPYPTAPTYVAPSVAPMGRRLVAPSNGFDMAGNDPRPHAWCMWWLRRHLGISKEAFPKWGWNIAANGRYIGTAASGPAAGVVVVWRHHVGIITGGSPGHWIVLSGNDNHAVRERERPLSGVISYRWPGSSTYFAKVASR